MQLFQGWGNLQNEDIWDILNVMLKGIIDSFRLAYFRVHESVIYARVVPVDFQTRRNGWNRSAAVLNQIPTIWLSEFKGIFLVTRKLYILSRVPEASFTKMD